MSHIPVLLNEALHALNIRSDGCYLDATFGRGGHSAAILNRLGSAGCLLAMDKDPEARKKAMEIQQKDRRFEFRQDSFALMDGFLMDRQGGSSLDGILMDLGVSSPQLDNAERGFSFSRSGPLDMRMDTDKGLTAAQWLQQASEAEIAHALFTYGEERFAKRIARSIVSHNKEEKITTTRQLAEIIRSSVPFVERHKDAATRSFQALRIVVNSELQDLQSGLEKAVNNMNSGGRLVVISFHSLEDRVVKRFMRDLSRPPVLPKGFPVAADEASLDLRVIGKAIKPSPDELRVNPRARSAIMRVAEKR